MKRSDMIETIEFELDRLGANEELTNGWATSILIKIEAAGMLPPPKDLVFPYGYQKSLDKQGIKRMVADYTTLDKWDAEVDTPTTNDEGVSNV